VKLSRPSTRWANYRSSKWRQLCGVSIRQGGFGQALGSRGLQVEGTRLVIWSPDGCPREGDAEALIDEPSPKQNELRLAYLLITKPRTKRRGITPKTGEWKGVESIFALHDHTFNKEWIKELTSKYLLNSKDLVEIRDRLGRRLHFTLLSCSPISCSSSRQDLGSVLGFFSDNSPPYTLLSTHCGG